jgi:hypothetical protein
MGAGMKVVIGLRAIALVTALAVVGLGAWCKEVRFEVKLILLTVIDSYIRRTRRRGTGSHGVTTTTARRVDSTTMASLLRGGHQQHY